ncbi:hypothetical protein ACH4UV_32940 [Streptomyces sp. NPDC020802]|uniref:hypothetical protein n=1 Tax=Streptomyces sp. NPDC020802 TaxID=3365094 RepID=UPI0037AFA85F
MNRKTRDRARDGLIDDLTRALHLIVTRDPDLARDRDRALARDPDLARDLALVLDLARARVLDRARDLDRTRDFDLVRDLDLVLDLARGFARDLADPDRTLVLNRARNLNRGGVAREIVRLLESARRKAALIVEAGVEPAADGFRVGVSGPARRLAEVASRVVPVRERARYAEEWRCELWELGHQKQGRRRRQLAYALRLLSRAWGVRGGVRAARHRPAGG